MSADDSSVDPLFETLLDHLRGELEESQLATLRAATLLFSPEKVQLVFENRFARDRFEKLGLEAEIRRFLVDRGEHRRFQLGVSRTPRKPRREPEGDLQQGLLAFDSAAPAASLVPPPNLNPGYTFASFVVGDSNRLPHAVCQAVAESPGGLDMNPVFLYGGVGLGKTHLMQAVGHSLYERDPSVRIRYVTSEVFANEFIEALQKKDTTRFRERHRNLDLLLIDDIQFFARMEETQKEFFHTFNELYQAGKQIFLTSDRSPKQLQGLEERLVSRFEGGTVQDIRPPNLEMRIGILRNWCRDAGLRAEDGALERLAAAVRSNIRRLRGAFQKTRALVSLEGRSVDLALVDEVAEEYGEGDTTERKLDVATIQELVAEYFRISLEDLTSKRRTKAIVRPRQVAMFLAYENTEETYEGIASAFGKKDHTTVMHACDKIRELIEEDAELEQSLRTLRGRLRDFSRHG